MKKTIIIICITMLLLLASCTSETDQQDKQLHEQQTQEKPVPKPPTKTQQDIGDVQPGPEDIIATGQPAQNKVTQRTPAQSHTVTIMRYAFNPKELTINAGDTVIWKNLGKTPHEMRSLKFHSNPLFQNDEYSYVFTQKGNHTVNSARYPATMGKVIVR